MGITSKILSERGRRQAQTQGIDPSRVPAGQYLTEKFPVLTYGRVPETDLSTWSLTVDGAVDSPVTVSWAELMAMDQVSQTVDIHCVTRWSKLDTTWTGVPVTALVGRAGLHADATHVMAHCDGGYTTNMPLPVLLDDDVLAGPHLRGQAAGGRPRRARCASSSPSATSGSRRSSCVAWRS